MNFTAFSQELDRIVENGVPEAEIIITKDHETVFSYAAGFADEAKTRPASVDNLMWLFSMTKVITMTAAMRLAERGVLDINASVEKYIPAFKGIRYVCDGAEVPCDKLPSVEQLMSMTAGFSYTRTSYPEVMKVLENSEASTLDVVNGFGKGPLRFAPGTRYQYSFCHDVVAGIIEVISGMRYGDFLKKEIFEPLGMENTGFRPTAAQKARFSTQYNCVQKGTDIHYEPNDQGNPFILSSKYESGGAGLFSCCSDYSRVLEALANEGTAANGYRLLSMDSINNMRKNRLSGKPLEDFRDIRNKQNYGYGLGVRTLTANVTSKGHVGEFGWDGAAGSYALVDPDNHISITYTEYIRSHSDAYSRLHPLLRDLVYEAVK